MYPPNFDEGTHLISGKGPTQFQEGRGEEGREEGRRSEESVVVIGSASRCRDGRGGMGSDPSIDSAEKPYECFDEAHTSTSSVERKISNDFTRSSLPVLWQTGVRPGSRRMNGRFFSRIGFCIRSLSPPASMDL